MRREKRLVSTIRGIRVVAAEMKGRRQGRGDHLAVAARAARVIAVAQAFENIVDDYVQISGFCDYFYRVGYGGRRAGGVGLSSQH